MHTVHRRAWGTLGAAIAVLAVLATQVPGPATVVAVLTGRRTLDVSGPLGPAESAMLLVSSLFIWPLLAWASGVAALALAARIPGSAGRAATGWLRRVAPGTVRRALVAGVGITLAAGLTACAGGQGSSALVPKAVAAVEGSAANPASETLGVLGSARRDLHVERETLDTRGDGRPTPVSVDWPDASATAGPGGSAAADQRDESGQHGVDVDWPAAPRQGPAEPQRPVPATGPSRQTTPNTSLQPITVRAGQTLWSIAADHLGPTATVAAIDASWRDWYQLNADTIGANPHHIEPGQVLLPPNQGSNR